MSMEAKLAREQEVRAAMRELATALLAGFDPAGIVVGKQQWLDDLASGALVFTSITSDEIELSTARRVVA